MRRPKIREVLGYVVLLCVLVWAVRTLFFRPQEIVFKWGESYEQIRQRYSLILPSPEPSLFASPPVVAKFRFDDPVYGFTTPRAIFLQMGADPVTGGFDSVQLSPQATPLKLDEVLAISKDIQDQLRRRGWRPFKYSGMRPIEDTPELRRALLACQFPTSVWNAADKYQVVINIGCHSIPQPVGKERYDVTLELGRPFWTDRPGD